MKGLYFIIQASTPGEESLYSSASYRQGDVMVSITGILLIHTPNGITAFDCEPHTVPEQPGGLILREFESCRCTLL